MRKFVMVTQIAAELSDPEDREASPAGEIGKGAAMSYEFDVADSASDSEILGIFHNTIPIGCLDDYEIEVVRVKEEASLFNKYNAYSPAGNALNQEFSALVRDWMGEKCKTYNPREVEDICLDVVWSVMAHQRIRAGLEMRRAERERTSYTMSSSHE